MHTSPRFRTLAALFVPLALLVAGVPRPVALRPGSPFLVRLPLQRVGRTLVVRRSRGAADTSPQPLAWLTELERVRPHAKQVEFLQTWGPPVDSRDSLAVDAGTLAPREESLVSPALKFRYRFDRTRVSGWIQRDDSSPRPIAAAWGEPFFAFSEVGPIVRSLRYAAGLAFVVTLFSEADVAVEHDTITVLRDSTLADGRGVWIVRFADPVIEQRYVVDSISRATVRIVTRQRRSGTVFDARPE